MACLRGLSGDFAGQIFELADDETTIGRHAGNKVALCDGSISSFHCCIIRDGSKYTVRDLDSTNGTRVNGQVITMRRLAPGNMVQVGSVELMFEGEDVDIEGIKASPAVQVETGVAVAARARAAGGDFKKSSSRGAKGMWVVFGLLFLVAIAGIVGLLVYLSGVR